MKKSRKKFYIILTVLTAIIASLSIAYAILSTTLTISGTTEVTAASWDIRLVPANNQAISKPKNYITTGSAVYYEPFFTKTQMEYVLELTKPGDSITYYLQIKNLGTINGEIESITHRTPFCNGTSEQDKELVCNNIIYDIRYYNGDEIKTGDTIGLNNEGDNGTVICSAGMETGDITRHYITLTVSLDQNLTQIPTNTVSVSNLITDIKIVQTDNKCQKSSSGVPEK